MRVPGAEGEIWRPQLALDGENRLWVVWAQLVDENFDLYAACYAEERWKKPVRLSSNPGADFNVSAASAPDGTIHIAWQGFRHGVSRILHRSYSAGSWSKTEQVSSGKGDNWEPDLAVASDGAVHIAWDSYRNGNYDVYLRSQRGGSWGEERQITRSPRFQAHASLALDSAGRVWIAWEEASANWGKDNGYAIRSRQPGVVLNAERSLAVRVLDGPRLRQPAADLRAAMPAGQRDRLRSPNLIADSEGRIWLNFRRRVRHEPTQPAGEDRRRVTSSWEIFLTRMDGAQWSEPVHLPRSANRISAFTSAAVAPDGKLWLSYSTDNRGFPNFHLPHKLDVWAYEADAAGAVSDPVLRDPDKPDMAAKAGHRDEPGDLARIRSHRVRIGGEDRLIVRGDIHRHTELSYDGGGNRDGSILDFYRYMIDAAAMDYGAVTDHNAGSDNEYFWWYTQKTTDLFHVPGGFTALYGYERSVSYPNGHRNVIHTRRNVPVVAHFRQLIGRGPGGVMENDTKLLYEAIRKTGGIAVSHTSGTRMGTDWRDNDPDLEPVVEIYQGLRASYEAHGAPRSTQAINGDQFAEKSPGGYRADGFVSYAWDKGYRLGVIASSDHSSTHISYAMAYVTENTREAVVDAYKARRTYGATDNIVVEFWADGRFMGEEYSTGNAPTFEIKVAGTGRIATIDLIKNNRVIHVFKPGKQSVDLTYRDNDFSDGTSFYYIRVLQRDEELAWASPIWVTKR